MCRKQGCESICFEYYFKNASLPHRTRHEDKKQTQERWASVDANGGLPCAQVNVDRHECFYYLLKSCQKEIEAHTKSNTDSQN